MISAFLNRIFSLPESGTTVTRELRGGTVTFLAMAYIIFVQPSVLSGQMLGVDTGLDFGAVMTATCLAAALATGLMAIYARYPIAQAPGMGENFFFVLSVVPAAAALGYAQPGFVALGTVFVAGVAFLLLSLFDLRVLLVDAIPPSCAIRRSTLSNSSRGTAPSRTSRSPKYRPSSRIEKPRTEFAAAVTLVTMRRAV